MIIKGLQAYSMQKADCGMHRLSRPAGAKACLPRAARGPHHGAPWRQGPVTPSQHWAGRSSHRCAAACNIATGPVVSSCTLDLGTVATAEPRCNPSGASMASVAPSAGLGPVADAAGPIPVSAPVSAGALASPAASSRRCVCRATGSPVSMNRTSGPVIARNSSSTKT